MDLQEAEGQAAIAAAIAEPPVTANVTVDRLKMRGGATLEDARIRLAVERGALTYLIADGRDPGGGAFSLALGPRPADPQGRIRFRAEDAGFSMRALTGAENVVGGVASAEGDWRAGPPSRAQFNVHMRDFEVVRLPAMTRLLSSFGSLTGIVETLNGDGIGFTSLESSMVYAGGRVTVSDGRAAGPSLGLTATGTYDLNRDNLDVDGVAVPSYGLNSMLGGVPILGDLLVSRRGEGVFGMTYSLNGPAAGPRVAVNPLSVITPGIFRRIFEPIAPRARAAEGAPPDRAALPRAEAAAVAPRP
jgi:AsmA-like C-terminal region